MEDMQSPERKKSICFSYPLLESYPSLSTCLWWTGYSRWEEIILMLWKHGEIWKVVFSVVSPCTVLSILPEWPVHCQGPWSYANSLSLISLKWKRILQTKEQQRVVIYEYWIIQGTSMLCSFFVIVPWENPPPDTHTHRPHHAHTQGMGEGETLLGDTNIIHAPFSFHPSSHPSLPLAISSSV